MARPGFWDDAAHVQDVSRQRREVTTGLGWGRLLEERSSDAQVLRDLVQEGEDAAVDFEAAVEALDKAVAEIELGTLLSGESDPANAIVTIHAGAGGTESMDWASMLLRMYLRWCQRRGFRARVLDEQPGEEAGLKSATFSIEGENAYG